MAFSPTVEKFTPQEKYFTNATSRNRSSDRNYKLIVKDKCCNHILPFAFMARQVALVSNSLFLLFILMSGQMKENVRLVVTCVQVLTETEN